MTLSRMAGVAAALGLGALLAVACGKGLDTNPEWADGSRFYLYASYSGAASSSVGRYEINPQDGSLSGPRVYSSPTLLDPRVVRVHPSQPYLVASYRGTVRGAGLFRIEKDGALIWLGSAATGGSTFYTADFHPSLSMFYLSEQQAGVNYVTQVLFDGQPGGVSLAGTVSPGAGNAPMAVRVNAAGTFVYESAGPSVYALPLGNTGNPLSSSANMPDCSAALVFDVGIFADAFFSVCSTGGVIYEHGTFNPANGGYTFPASAGAPPVLNAADTARGRAFSVAVGSNGGGAGQILPIRLTPDGAGFSLGAVQSYGVTLGAVAIDPTERFVYISDPGMTLIAIFEIDYANLQLVLRGTVSSPGIGGLATARVRP